jgi:peptidyl-prolyl cis-trans isomerase SurA
MKKTIFSTLSMLIATVSIGQTLFTYGNKEVSKQAFLAAYYKNPSTETDKQKALNEYLGLYINYKLKVQAAYDEKLHEQPTIQQESNNFKTQIADNLINEEANIQALVKEAFSRSQKDILVGHIFIEVPKGKDTITAFKQINEAYAQLKAGVNFGTVATKYNTNENLQNNQGNIGYITAFSFKYAFEKQNR